MYSQIINPKSGRKVSIFGKKGREILENYLIQNGGTTTEGESKISRDSTGVIVYSEPSIKELIEREEKYVQSLEELIENLPKFDQIIQNYISLKKGYKRKIKNNAKLIVKNKTLEKMKNALIHLYYVHRDEILKVFKMEHVCSNMGLKRLFNKLTKHYIIYGKLYMDVFLLLNKLMEYFRSIEKTSLYDFLHISLIKPVQQLPRYPLHYGDIIKRNKTKFNSRRLDNCKNVLDLLIKVNIDLNKGLSDIN